MSTHAYAEIRRANLKTAGPKLVECIAALPPKTGETQRDFISFAAKFCHFFVDAERFPIYDDAARNVLRLHLGPERKRGQPRGAYASFVTRVRFLRSKAQLTCSNRELDRYLWLTGMYRKWLRERNKDNPEVNVELQEVFQNPSPAVTRELDLMLPRGVERTF